MADGRCLSQIQAEEGKVDVEQLTLSIGDRSDRIRPYTTVFGIHLAKLVRDLDLTSIVERIGVNADQLGKLGQRFIAEAEHEFERLLHCVVQAEHDRERDELRQTARHRADTMAVIQLLHLLIELDAVIRILFLQLLQFRVERRHLEHALFALDGQRQDDQLDEQRE